MAFEFSHIHSCSVVYAQPSGHWLDMPVNERLILNNIIEYVLHIQIYRQIHFCYLFFTLSMENESLLCYFVYFCSRLLQLVLSMVHIFSGLCFSPLCIHLVYTKSFTNFCDAYFHATTVEHH